MKQIGRRIYWDKLAGNNILDTGERSGEVVETTVEQDFASYRELAERVPETVGMIQLEFGELEQDFRESKDYRVNPETEKLEFLQPDPTQPEAPPVYAKPLSLQLSELREDYTSRMSQMQDDQNMLFEAMIEAGIVS